MPTLKTKITLLLATFGIALVHPTETLAQRKKGSTHKTTTARSSKKGSKKSASQTSKKSSSRHSRRQATRSYARSSAPKALTEEQLEKMRQDSIRLRTGGTSVSTKTLDRASQAPELLTTRFRQADSTLSRGELRELYFAPQTKEDTDAFIAQIELSADQQIEKHRFEEALRLVQQGLWRMPTHLGLIKRACDLSSHLKSPRFNSYIYQLVELLSMISHSGDGSSPEKAIEVRSLSDALLFEQLWKETPKERLTTPKEIQQGGKTYYLFSFKDEQGKSVQRYYYIRTTPYR